MRSICTKCYVERNEIVWIDHLIRLTRCPSCGFFKIAGKWKEIGLKDALMDVIYSSLRVHPEFNVYNLSISGNGRWVLRISGRMWGEDVSMEKTIEVRIESKTCLRCSMEAGGYYESIVQIRAENRDVGEDELDLAKAIVNEIIGKEKSMKAFVSKVVKRKEGVDYYIGDRNIGKKISKQIAEQLGGKITESKKIVGRSDGRESFRFTYLVRLPVYRRGDVVEENEKICVVINQLQGKGIVLETGETYNLKKPRVIVKRDEIKRSIVLNIDEFAVEVLHPATQRAVSTRKPKSSLKPGDEVLVAEHKGRIYVIPKELVG